ncbi:hypothetical protein AB0G53_29460, partial [Streptomyces sp. NPDC021722]
MTPQIEELTYEAWGLAPSRLVAGTLPEMPSSRVVPSSSLTQRDVLADYGAHLRSLVDLTAIRPLKVV